MAFQTHTTGTTDRGSRVLMAITGALVVVLVAGAYTFWTDRPALLRHVRDQDLLAVPAVWVMIRQGVDDPTARGPLIAALESGPPSLRAAAATALGSLHKHDLVVDLAQAASDPEPGVRLAAMEALEVMAEPSSAPCVRLALDDPSSEVQAVACRCVGVIGLREYIPLLIEKLEAGDNKVKNGARVGLEHFVPPGENSQDFDALRWHRLLDGR